MANKAAKEGTAQAVVSPFNIYKASTEHFKLKALFYGPPGVGKTTLCATADLVPEMYPAIVMNIEAGVLSLTDPGVYGGKEPVDVVDFTSWEDLDKFIHWLEDMEHGYKTVIVDSVSEMTKLSLDHVVANATKKRPEDEVFLEDYGSNNKRMRRFIRRFRDLPMHVLMTCHDSEIEDSDKSKKTVPGLSPKLRTSVCGYVDVVGYVYRDDVEEDDKTSDRGVRMLTKPWPKWEAKDRSPGEKLPEIMKNPTMETIWRAITSR